VLSGGELAAAVVLDATARLLPGVLGHADSARYESFGLADSELSPDPEALSDDGVPRSTHGSGGLLDYSHYTRPAEFRGVAVPEVLLGGDHAAIRRWRRREQLRKTLLNRPDLLNEAVLDGGDRKLLEELRKEVSSR
jgi:tRNA (guanine37-N1)-methyltransferase